MKVFRWRVYASQVVSVFMVLALTMTFSKDDNATSSCHAYSSLSQSKTYPWNSRLLRSSTPTKITTSTTTTSLTSTTKDTTSLLTTTTTRNNNNGSEINGITHQTNSNNIDNNDNNNVDDSPKNHQNVKTSEVLSLNSIRASLIRQEETIIFALIERAQFRRNPIVYQKNGLGRLGTPPGSKVLAVTTTTTTTAHPNNSNDENEEELSFLEYMLMGTEALHFAVRRYTSPEEHAFFPDRLPDKQVLEELVYPNLLSKDADDVNFNEILLQKYIQEVVPAICLPGDDEQHGSTALCDVAVLQALSKRVHYGKFVAESKYLADPQAYQTLVNAGDAQGVMKLLTNETVEAKVLRRARLKAATYGTEPLLAELPPLETKREITSIVAAAAASAVVAALEAMGDDIHSSTEKKVCPSTVEDIYRDLIIPLTKDVEVAYLFRRCGRELPPEFSPHRMSNTHHSGTTSSTTL